MSLEVVVQVSLSTAWVEASVGLDEAPPALKPCVEPPLPTRTVDAPMTLRLSASPAAVRPSLLAAEHAAVRHQVFANG